MIFIWFILNSSLSLFLINLNGFLFDTVHSLSYTIVLCTYETIYSLVSTIAYLLRINLCLGYRTINYSFLCGLLIPWRLILSSSLDMCVYVCVCTYCRLKKTKKK